MSKLEWEKQNTNDKAFKDELVVSRPHKIKSTLDYYLRLKSAISRVEDEVWKNKKSTKLQDKARSYAFTELSYIHTALLNGDNRYNGSKSYLKVIRLFEVESSYLLKSDD